MAWNDCTPGRALLNRFKQATAQTPQEGAKATVATTLLLLASTALLGACSVAGPRESPLNEVTAGSPTVSEVYRGQASSASDAKEVRERLHSSSPARSLSQDDARESAYWTPLEPMQQRFARVPNPDLVMVVFPHLAKGKYPVPGYVTVFPMYEQTHYALPGEIEIEQERARARFQASGAPVQRHAHDEKNARPGASR